MFSFPLRKIQNAMAPKSIIMNRTESFSNWFRTTYTTNLDILFSFVEISMLFITLQQNKITNSIINFVMIDMMNYFITFKISAQMFFHYKSMFSNITSTICKWVFFTMNKFISTVVKMNTTCPKSTFISSDSSLLVDMSTCIRTNFTSPMPQSIFFSFKSFVANFTNNINVYHTPILYRKCKGRSRFYQSVNY